MKQIRFPARNRALLLALSLSPISTSVVAQEDAEYGAAQVAVSEGVERGGIVFPGEPTPRAVVTLRGPGIDQQVETNAAGHAEFPRLMAGQYRVNVKVGEKEQTFYVRVSKGETANGLAFASAMCTDAETVESAVSAVNAAVKACSAQALEEARKRLEKVRACRDADLANLERYMESEQAANGLPNDSEGIHQQWLEITGLISDNQKADRHFDANALYSRASLVFAFWTIVTERDRLKGQLRALDEARSRTLPANCTPKPVGIVTTEGPVRPILPELQYWGVPGWICSAAILDEWRGAYRLEIAKAQGAQDTIKAYRQSIDLQIENLKLAGGDRATMSKLMNEGYWASAQQAAIESNLRAAIVARDSLAKSRPMNCLPGTVERRPGK